MAKLYILHYREEGSKEWVKWMPPMGERFVLSFDLPYFNIAYYPNGFCTHYEGEFPSVFSNASYLEDFKKSFKLMVQADPEWRYREERRFDTGEYHRIPWDLPEIKDHYAHLSVSSLGLIAYTPTPQKGEVDIQVTTKPGRYLAKFYPHLTLEQVRDYAMKVGNNFNLKFATEPKDIEYVYRRGPSSCMSGNSGRFQSEVHPVRAYGAGDLACAYIESNGKILTRAMCWPEKKEYTRIYSATPEMRELMEKMFEEQGYKIQEDGFSDGAKLLYIGQDSYKNCEGECDDPSECDNCDIERPSRGQAYIIAPYVDWQQRAKLVKKADKKHLVLCRDGNISLDSTSGVVLIETPFCHFYRRETDEPVSHVWLDRFRQVTWSESAIEAHAYRCPGSGELCADTIERVEFEGDSYSIIYMEQNYAKCSVGGHWFQTGSITGMSCHGYLGGTNEQSIVDANYMRKLGYYPQTTYSRYGEQRRWQIWWPSENDMIVFQSKEKAAKKEGEKREYPYKYEAKPIIDIERDYFERLCREIDTQTPVVIAHQCSGPIPLTSGWVNEAASVTISETAYEPEQVIRNSRTRGQ